MVLELEGADGVGDAFERVLEAVGPVVHRVDAPGGAGVVVFLVDDAVEDRIAEVEVGRGEVDLGADGHRAVGVLAGLHLFDELEALGGGAITEG